MGGQHIPPLRRIISAGEVTSLRKNGDSRVFLALKVGVTGETFAKKVENLAALLG